MDERASMDQLATLMAESENNINGIIRSSRIAGPTNQDTVIYGTGCKELSRKQSRRQTHRPRMTPSPPNVWREEELN